MTEATVVPISMEICLISISWLYMPESPGHQFDQPTNQLRYQNLQCVAAAKHLKTMQPKGSLGKAGKIPRHLQSNVLLFQVVWQVVPQFKVPFERFVLSLIRLSQEDC